MHVMKDQDLTKLIIFEKMGDIGLKARGQTEKKLLSEALRIFIHG